MNKKQKQTLTKIISLIFLCLNLVSCDKYAQNDYPQTVSKDDGFQEINSRYEKEVTDLNGFPNRIQNLAKKYLTKNIGNSLFKNSKFTYGYISSNKILDSFKTKNHSERILYGDNYKIDTTYNYPVFSFAFQLSLLKKGIKKYDLNFIMDNDGNILKEIEFPKLNFENNTLNIIPIDSIHRILISNKIPSKKLHLDLKFDRNEESLFYQASTLIRKGSFTGPSCLPEYKYHFKVNALTGEISEDDPNKLIKNKKTPYNKTYK